MQGTYPKIIELFQSYRALGHTSTSMPHEFSDKSDPICTTLLTPNGLGIRTYKQYHQRRSGRRGRPALEIIFVFQSENWLKAFPNQYYARTDANINSRARHWQPGILNPSIPAPEGLRRIYQEDIMDLLHKKKGSSEVVTTNMQMNRVIKKKTPQKSQLTAIAQEVYKARKKAKFKDLILGFSEIIIPATSVVCIFVKKECRKTRILAFLSNAVRSVNLGESIKAALVHPKTPVIINNGQTISHYTTQHFYEDIKLLNFYDLQHNQGFLELQSIISSNTMQFTNIANMIIEIIRQSKSFHVSSKTQSSEQVDINLNMIFILLKLRQKFKYNIEYLKQFNAKQIAQIIKISLQFTKNHTVIDNIFLLILQSEPKKFREYITELQAIDSSLMGYICQHHYSKFNKNIQVESNNIKYLTFKIHIFMITLPPSVSLIHMQCQELYASQTFFKQSSCSKLFSCYSQRSWIKFLQKLENILEKKDIKQFKKILCEKLLSMSKINHQTLFIYTALKIAAYHSHGISQNISESKDPDQEEMSTDKNIDILPLPIAQAAAAYYLRQYRAVSKKDSTFKNPLQEDPENTTKQLPLMTIKI